MKFDQLVNAYLSEKSAYDEDNQFIKNVADAAEAGKKFTTVGGKKVPVKMSKKTADKIEGVKSKKSKKK